MKRFLFDTDVIMDYLRGYKPAIEYFETIDGEFNLSAITIAELYTGVKGEEERNQFEYFYLSSKSFLYPKKLQPKVVN